MVEVMDPLRVVAFQRRPHFDDVSGITQRLAEDLKWCDYKNAHLALFPECYLQGYATDKATIARRALALNGTEFGVVLAKLAPFRTTVVLGIIEQRGNACYNSAAVIKDGVLLGAYAKSHQ